MAKLMRSLVTLVLTAGMVVGLSGTANAADEAENSKGSYLTQFPEDGMPTSCTERRLYLGSGLYDWGQRRLSQPGTRFVIRRDLRLGAGWYTWRDCLDPKYSYYRQTTWLDPDNPAWVTISIGSDQRTPGTGYYRWGSFLNPHF